DGDVRITQAVLSARQLRAQADGGGEGAEGLLVTLVLLGPQGGEVPHLRDVEGGVLLLTTAEDAQHGLGLGRARGDVRAIHERLRRERGAGAHGLAGWLVGARAGRARAGRRGGGVDAMLHGAPPPPSPLRARCPAAVSGVSDEEI